jgi:mitogen-activated protein kinase kinase
MADSAFKQKTMKRKNVKGLALSAPPPKPAPSAGDAQIPGARANDEKHDTLEIGVEFQLDLKAEDLIVLRELGSGNGGTVSKVQHAATKVIMARKVIHVEAKNEVRKRIVRELRIMHDCNSDYIVDFYGAFQNSSGDVIMCMEYMDVGSLDWVSRTFGPVRVDVLGKISEAVLGGLAYLYSAHRIMHRDLKPSNILVNSKGNIKLCDFGVSSELEGSIAETFVGTGTYMAPERIQGSPYTVKSDVWSVGLTLMELAIGKFPFAGSADDDDEAGGPQGILDLLQQIVLEPSPKLPKSDAFPSILEDMIAKCLMKDPAERPTPKELYVSPQPRSQTRQLLTISGPRRLPPSRKAHPRRPRSLGHLHDRAQQTQIAPRPRRSRRYHQREAPRALTPFKARLSRHQTATTESTHCSLRLGRSVTAIVSHTDVEQLYFKSHEPAHAASTARRRS